MPEFVPGLSLAESLYREVVRPLLDERFPGLPYAAALVGPGSEVLGYDTPRSTDHGWGPRVQVFLAGAEPAGRIDEVRRGLSGGVPELHRGWPVLGVRVLTVPELLRETLAVESTAAVGPEDWVTFPEQGLLALTRGRVFADEPGELTAVREFLAYYPDAIWRYLLAAQWRRISQDEHLAPRCAEVGDELGSRIVAARLVKDVVRLAFLLERRYAPYPKWLGTAFAELSISKELAPALARALDARDWAEREAGLARAYEIVAERQNALGLSEPVEATVSRFHDRPFLVIHAERFSDAIRATIYDERVRGWPEHIGGVEQISDSTDVLDYPAIRARLKALYGR